MSISLGYILCQFPLMSSIAKTYVGSSQIPGFRLYSDENLDNVMYSVTSIVTVLIITIVTCMLISADLFQDRTIKAKIRHAAYYPHLFLILATLLLYTLGNGIGKIPKTTATHYKFVPFVAVHLGLMSTLLA